ncbi:MAG: aminotransferase class I/II-fold pyridoxal phosphate-dependent enzyme [Chloroflexota bacterium]|nr:aminotransferase class I/II-fold pyridoxal phosphate-dependent enzyme [Chloroflexota bacterium]
MTLDTRTLDILREAVLHLDAGFAHLPAFESDADADAIRAVLLEAAERMRDNYPYQHPLYAGQMLKPPHAVARLAYALAMYINPNNHALDGSRASSPMEKEAVAQIAAMFGWQTHLGHLTSSGTLANLEALWVGGRLKPGKTVLASEQAHYTHSRISDVLGLPFESVATDSRARLDVNALEDRLKRGDVGLVVVTLGTTSTGSVDPLPDVLALRDRYGFRIHADAAYGGYFTLADNLEADAQAAYDCLAEVDSLAIDPHKHGLQPYGCGCILFRDPSVGRLYSHDSPYTYFTSAELHLGEISLECSRAGAAAVALWTTMRLFPLERGGAFAADISKARAAALALYDKLHTDADFLVAFPPELDIVIYAPRATSAAAISAETRALFERAAARDLHLAVATLPAALLRPYWDIEWDTERVAVLRSVLMKPEHLDWIDAIYARLRASLR